MRRFFIFFVIISMFVSCIQKTDKEIYQENANLFISQYLSEINYGNCIVEPYEKNILDLTKSSLPKEFFVKYKKSFMQALDITNDSLLNTQIELADDFDFNKQSLNLEINYIKRSDIIPTDKIWEIREFLLTTPCQKGFIIISKPIFNKNYTKAIFYSEGISSGSSTAYELVNGEWKGYENLDNWIN